MSTRSNIAIQKPDGSILSIYVHSDGYPDGVGQCLIDNYETYGSSLRLFEHGDASYLGSTLKEYRFDLVKIFNQFIEFVYLFRDGQWLVSDNYDKPVLDFVPVKEHKDYSGKKSGITEKEMISQIGNLLKGAGFKDEDVSMQTFASKKKMN